MSTQPERSNPRAVAMSGSVRIEDLRAEARYHRERYDLYKAKMYGQRPTTMSRLRELERICRDAETRLHRAEQERASRDGR